MVYQFEDEVKRLFRFDQVVQLDDVLVLELHVNLGRSVKFLPVKTTLFYLFDCVFVARRLVDSNEGFPVVLRA